MNKLIHTLIAQDMAGLATEIIGADANGAAQRALNMTVDYVKTRKQFDRLIGSFQGLQYQIVDVAIQQ